MNGKEFQTKQDQSMLEIERFSRNARFEAFEEERQRFHRESKNDGSISFEDITNQKEESRRKRAQRYIAEGQRILIDQFMDEYPYPGRTGIALKLKRSWVKEKFWTYYAEWLYKNYSFEPIQDYASFLALDNQSSQEYFNIPVTLSERKPLNQHPEISNHSDQLIEETDLADESENDIDTESWTLYTFSYEESPVDYSDRQSWKSLSTEEIVTKKMGLDYASVLKEFKEANPEDARWMNLWIKRCIIDKGWNENDPVPHIREIEVWEDPNTGEPVIEAFSFSDARKKAKEIGVTDFETFYWQRKISGKKEHFMKGYQGPEIYYNQTHLSGKNYQQMVEELYKVSGDDAAYQNALQDGEIGQGFVDLVKSAQEVVFFNKRNLDEYRDGLFGNDTRNAIDAYLSEIKGRDSYWEAMIRRFAREKSITVEEARRITADFWSRPDVIERQDQAMQQEAYLKANNPGFDTNLKVAMAKQPEYIQKEMAQKYSIYRVDNMKAKLDAELQTEIKLFTRTDNQIANQLIEKYPPRKPVQKKTGNPTLLKGGFYDPNLIPLSKPYYIEPAISTYVAPSYFIWDNSPLKFNFEKHPYIPKFDPNANYSDQLIQRFEYWKKWENEEVEMKQIEAQSQTLKDQSSEMTDADDQFISFVCNELGYSKANMGQGELKKDIIYLSPLEQKEQKTFYEAWMELKIELIMLPQAQKKSAKLSTKIVNTYHQFERLLFAHGDHLIGSGSMNSEDLKGISGSFETLLKSPENFEEIQRKIIFYRQVMRVMLQKEIQSLEDTEKKRNLTDYSQQHTSSRELYSLVKKAKSNADSSGHTFTKIPATFTTKLDDQDKENSFIGPYTKVETKGQDIKMYVEKNSDVIVHLFLGASEDNHFQFTGSSISDALKDMNSVKGVLPPGVIRYQTEKGWYQEFIVNPPSWTWSEALGVASLVLAVIAIPVTGGASVVLVVAATATGVASSGFYMYEENLKGQLSTGEVWRESGFMVANLLPMVRGINTMAKLSKTSGLLGKIGTVAEGYTYLKVSVGAGITATTIDGIIIADSYYKKFEEIDAMKNLSPEERDIKRAQLLREGLLTGLITLTGFLDLASLKKPRSNNSKHWSGPDVPATGKSKTTGITTPDAGTPHPVSGGAEPTGTNQLSGSTPQGTAPGKKKTTKVVVAQDAEGNFHKQNPETGKFEKISKEEFEQLDAATKKNGGEVVKSEKKGKLGEDVENGTVKNADENIDDLTTKENEVVSSKENGKLGESSLDVNQTKNLLSREVLMSYEFYGIRAVRIKEGVNGKVAIIGQSMGDFAKRGEYGVVDYARALRAKGYETELFAGPRITREARDELDDLRAEFGRDLTPSELETTIAYKENMAWAKWVKEEGFTIIDIGNPNNKTYSHFYNGECINIFGN